MGHWHGVLYRERDGALFSAGLLKPGVSALFFKRFNGPAQSQRAPLARHPNVRFPRAFFSELLTPMELGNFDLEPEMS